MLGAGTEAGTGSEAGGYGAAVVLAAGCGRVARAEPAWDDDEIDDPDAEPADGWQRTRSTWRSADLAGDALELLGRHYTRRQVAERLGVTVAAIDKALERTGQVAA